MGVYDKAYEWLKAHRLVTLILMAGYLFVYYITYDAVARRERQRYNKKLEGASLRRRLKDRKR